MNGAFFIFYIQWKTAKKRNKNNGKFAFYLKWCYISQNIIFITKKKKVE